MLWPDRTAGQSCSTLQKTLSQTHTLSHTHTVTLTPVAAAPGWVSSLARILCCETRLITFSLPPLVSHICWLAWQPAGPHASTGVAFALLFVSQNNTKSPIVFPVPHLCSPTPPTVPWTLFAGSEWLKHLTLWCPTLLVTLCLLHMKWLTLVTESHWGMTFYKHFSCG